MGKKRNLADLFVVGQEVTLDDGKGALTVWIQKLNPVEHEKAMRRASGARARVLSGKDAAETEMATDEAAMYGREGWVEYLASDALGRRLGAIEGELAGEKEWADQGYLQGLKDVWEASAEEALKDDPDDVSALRVRDELGRFQEELEKLVEGERERLIKDFESKPDEDLERRVVDRLVATRGDLAWLTEFRRCEIWLSTRESENHLAYLFKEREGVDQVSQEVLVRLMSAYQDLSVDPSEGKSLGATQTSSKSSDSPATEETAESSGQEAATT